MHTCVQTLRLVLTPLRRGLGGLWALGRHDQWMWIRSAASNQFETQAPDGSSVLRLPQPSVLRRARGKRTK